MKLNFGHQDEIFEKNNLIDWTYPLNNLIDWTYPLDISYRLDIPLQIKGFTPKRSNLRPHIRLVQLPTKII